MGFSGLRPAASVTKSEIAITYAAVIDIAGSLAEYLGMATAVEDTRARLETAEALAARGLSDALGLPVIQRGSAAITGTGKSASIAATITAASRIEVTVKTPVGDALTIKYGALSADRVIGAPGSFMIAALVAAGGGAVNVADSSTVDYLIVG